MERSQKSCQICKLGIPVNVAWDAWCICGAEEADTMTVGPGWSKLDNSLSTSSCPSCRGPALCPARLLFAMNVYRDIVHPQEQTDISASLFQYHQVTFCFPMISSELFQRQRLRNKQGAKWDSKQEFEGALINFYNKASYFGRHVPCWVM